MPIRIACTAALALALFSGTPRAGDDLRAWTHRAELSIPAGNALVELPLPPDIMDLALNDWRDLRLEDESGAALPYVIDEGQPTVPDNRQPATAQLNAVFRPGEYSSVVTDFGAVHLRTHLLVSVEGDNFRRRARVEGGNDAVTWNTLTESAWLFAIPSPEGPRRVERISLGNANYRYYRVTVYNAADDQATVKIRSVEALRREERTGEYLPVRLAGSTARPHPDRSKVTWIELDFGLRNMPLRDVTLAFAEADFSRACEIYGRNSATHTVIRRIEDAAPRPVEMETPWDQLGTGTLCRVSSGTQDTEGLTLACPGRWRYVAVAILDRDDRPLTFTGAMARRLNPKLLFKHPSGTTARLYVGNAKAETMSYDIGQYVDTLRRAGTVTAAAHAVVPNPNHAIPETVLPWSERHKALLGAALAALVAAMGWVLWRQGRAIPPQQPPTA